MTITYGKLKPIHFFDDMVLRYLDESKLFTISFEINGIVTRFPLTNHAVSIEPNYEHALINPLTFEINSTTAQPFLVLNLTDDEDPQIKHLLLQIQIGRVMGSEVNISIIQSSASSSIISQIDFKNCIVVSVLGVDSNLSVPRTKFKIKPFEVFYNV